MEGHIGTIAVTAARVHRGDGRPTCCRFADRGIRAGLKVMMYSAVKTVHDALRIVEQAEHPTGAVLV